jgi:N-acetylmuramoyl-L-alanine amidase
MPDVVLLDTAADQPNPPPRLVRNGELRYRTVGPGPHARVLERDPATVDTICVHQTACVFGPAGDLTRRHDRAHDVPIHALAFRDGVLALPYPARWYLFHGNGWNARSLGLEIEGRYEGVETNPSTLPDPRNERDVHATYDVLDDLTIATARAGIDAMLARGRALGMPIKYIVAHRQSSGTRRADPGSAIWKHVVIEHAVAVRGLITLPSMTVGEGRPIPLEWDPAGRGHY